MCGVRAAGTDYENMGTVGSIRSSRNIFAETVPDFDAIYVHAGGSPGAYSIILNRGLTNLDGANMYLPSTYFRDQWRLMGDTPEPGDLIFFDWEQDGARDHVGIVTAVVDDKVFTVEGNSSDLCRQKRYSLDDPVIYGYGVIKE